jgi:hypothetical protein
MVKGFIILLTFLSFNVFGQDNLTEQAKLIVAEGKLLYKSEMASWYGTDILMENNKDRANMGGYFSYEENEISKCIFFSTSGKPKVIGEISFDSTYDTKTAKTIWTEREFTNYESDIYIIRKSALEAINTDTLFKTYQNSNLNVIPLVSEGVKRVYVLTGPQKKGVVIFGNDYLINFDKNNNLISKKQLHRNIIPINYGGKEEEGKEIEGTIHSHLPETGDFITATDICTLMLYEKFAKWNQHNVVSKNYLSIWNCLTDELVVVPMSTLHKINKDQEKRKKKRND